MFSNETILIAGFIASIGYAYWNQVRYDAQLRLNDELISIIRKKEAHLQEYKDCLGK